MDTLEYNSINIKMRLRIQERSVIIEGKFRESNEGFYGRFDITLVWDMLKENLIRRLDINDDLGILRRVLEAKSIESSSSIAKDILEDYLNRH